MAKSPLKFLGWKRYTNTGRIYRRWEVQRVKDGADVEEGDLVDDRGPDEDPRIAVKRDGDWVKDLSPDEAPEFFSSICRTGFPTWDPPTGVDVELIEWIEWLGKQIQRLPATIRSSSSGPPSKLRQVANQVDPETSDGRVVGSLQVVREGSYSNTGGSFRIWRFLEDCPEVPAPDHTRVGGPDHAREGDELWQQPDRLTPWKLKRDEVEIGGPEDWQLRGAFGGSIPGWGEDWRGGAGGNNSGGSGGTGASRDGPHPDLYRYVSEETEHGQAVETGGAEYEHVAKARGVYRLTRDLPIIGAERGDVLVYAKSLKLRPAEVHGDLYGLQVRELYMLRDELLSHFIGRDHAKLKVKVGSVVLKFMECLSGPPEHMTGVYRRSDYRGRYYYASGITAFLGDAKQWGQKLKDFYSRLLLLKPHAKPERTTRPIRAASDQSAAFELLAQVTEEGGAS